MEGEMKTQMLPTASHVFFVSRHEVYQHRAFSDPWDQNQFIQLMVKHLLPETQPLAYCILHDTYQMLLYVTKYAHEEDVKSKFILPIETDYQSHLNRKKNRNNTILSFSGEISLVPPYLIKQRICEIHEQPVLHLLCEHPLQWQYSSYPSILLREALLIDPWLSSSLFGGIRGMKEAHQSYLYRARQLSGAV